MKKYYEYFGLALIMLFSFYYTEQISSIVLNKNPLMIAIKEKERDYEISAVSAIIDGDTIIPGIRGQKVNSRESFYRMQENNVFQDTFLVFDKIKPEISLEDHKDKIIKKGNPKLKKISFISENEGNISNYFKANKIPLSLLVTVETYKSKSYFEMINNEVTNFKSLENSLNLNKENKHICIINTSNKDICLKNKNYLVEPEYRLTGSNLTETKKGILNGGIIYLTKEAKLDDVIYLLMLAKYKGLTIVNLSELITE